MKFKKLCISIASATTIMTCQNVSSQAANNKSLLASSSSTLSLNKIKISQSPLKHSIQITQRIATAPLIIQSAAGRNYFVKLVDTYSQATVMTMFVYGGSSARYEVPLGNYELRYASGYNWYGYQYLFGSQTSYNRAQNIFSFRRGMGFTITLYAVANGNLSTVRIDQTQF